LPAGIDPAKRKALITRCHCIEHMIQCDN